MSWGLSALSERPEAGELTFGALGENLIHRPICHYALQNLDGSFDHLSAPRPEELARYDVACLHQETIYVERRQDYSDYPLFGTPAAACQAADFVLVLVHWGTEYAPQPDDVQRRWASVLADCGVDVVLGTGPRVLQPYEWVAGEGGNRTLV